jgi:hypothetical protein
MVLRDDELLTPRLGANLLETPDRAAVQGKYLSSYQAFDPDFVPRHLKLRGYD